MFSKLIALELAKWNSLAETYNLNIGYTFDLRRHKYLPEIARIFQDYIRPQNRNFELCNYLEYMDLPELHKENITLHLTGYKEPLTGTFYGLLPGLPKTANIFTKANNDFYKFINRFQNNLRYISLHLGGCVEDYEFDDYVSGAMKPKPKAVFIDREQALTNCRQSIQTLRQNLPDNLQNKILLETLDYEYFGEKASSAYRYFCEPEVIADIVQSTGSGLLIDISHVLITVRNLLGAKVDDVYAQTINYLDTICAKHYELIKEVHIFPAGYDVENGLMHHYDAPLFKERAMASFQWEYRLLINVLRHIICEHNLQTAQKLIVNFETAVGWEMWQDIQLFNSAIQEP
jgi:uncharacterized protein (UPF0276 family)